MPGLLLPLVGFSFLAVLGFPLRAKAGDTLSYRGFASDLATGRPVFTEIHREHVEAGRTLQHWTRYEDPEGKVIAERTLDFRGDSLLPGFRLEDFRTGALETCEKDGGEVRLAHRDRRGAPLRERTLRVSSPAVVDGGFNVYLRSRWDALAAGDRISFHVVVPSRLAQYRFTAFEDRESSAKGLRVFVARPENRILRLFAPRIEVTYDESSRRIRRFRGISNVAAADGSTLQVDLVYPEGGP